MGLKRFAEYRYIADPERAGLYRESFKTYNETSLLVSSFFYAISCSFFLGVFLVKYRIEYLLFFPFLSLLFAWYLKMGLNAQSSVQSPEDLYKEHSFSAYTVFLCGLFLVLSYVNIPWLGVLLRHSLVQW